jgi:hypothetical protein
MPSNFCCNECAGRVLVSIRSPWRRIAEHFRYAMRAGALVLILAATAGCGPVTSGPGISAAERDRIVSIAQRAVATNDTWADRATYDVERHGQGWDVTASRIEGHDFLGRRLYAQGGFRTIKIDEHGNVTNYYRGY